MKPNDPLCSGLGGGEGPRAVMDSGAQVEFGTGRVPTGVEAMMLSRDFLGRRGAPKVPREVKSQSGEEEVPRR